MREKGGTDEQQQSGIPDYLECGPENTTNPFINYNNTQSPKFQMKYCRDLPLQNSNIAPQLVDSYGVCGESVAHRRPYRPAEAGRQSGIPISSSSSSAQEGYCGPSFSRPSHIPIAEPDRRIILNEDHLKHYAPPDVGRVISSSNGNDAKVSEEKTLGESPHYMALFFQLLLIVVYSFSVSNCCCAPHLIVSSSWHASSLSFSPMDLLNQCRMA